MQKVVAIKFLKVEWSPKDSRDERSIQLAFDTALSQLESKISVYLKNGWAMKGEVSYPQYIVPDSSHYVKHHLVQTMVRYEESKVEDLLKL
jgi:hypothetical protein